MIISQNHFETLKSAAFNLGFIACGITTADIPIHYDYFVSWLKAGKYGDMEWLKNSSDIRKSLESLLKGCSSVISLAYPYSSGAPATPDGFKVARYSEPWHEDYHYRLKQKCKHLTKLLSELCPESKSRICVDSAPIMEKSFAVMSGIGFQGKNTMLIVPGFGSWVYLAEILTTAQYNSNNTPILNDSCNGCEECLNSCPTGALESPNLINSAKCLSYQTIEATKDISPSTGRYMGKCFSGCDRCQEVCPHNVKTEDLISIPSTNELLQMKEEEFNLIFGKTSLKRAGLHRIISSINAIKFSTESGKT